MTAEEARTLSEVVHATGSNNVVPKKQYLIEDRVTDSKSGFDCTIYRKIGTNEIIVAFAGTRDGQDVVADLALGKRQWEESRAQLWNSLNKLHATQISFTGYSLGGAVAQYAAYDYIRQNPNNHANVKLCTFNGLGGMDGITQMHSNDVSSGKFDTIVRQIDAAHFFASSSGKSDMVARLGGGHLGGNTFEIKMATLKASLLAIHQAWDDFANLTVPQYITRPDYLNIPHAQNLAALIAYLGTDGNMTDAEGWMRAAGGAFLAASLLSNDELNELLKAFNPNKLLAGDYHVRDLSPVVRLGFLIAGAGALVGAEVIDFGADASKLATKAIEETILAYEQCVKLFQHTYEQAMESASDSIDVISDAFAEAFEFAATRIIDLAGHYTEAVDYIAGKWNDLQALGHQIVDWLNDQLLFFSNNSMEVVNSFLNLVASNASGAALIRMLFSSAETVMSPIILDLDGDGVETTGVKSGAYFDHDGNGFAEQTGWANRDDGLLVFDKNGNGTIDSGQELFGDQTLLANGSRAANGFLALAELDGNADGKIDVSDAAYDNLKIWQDVDGDGYSTPSELKTLSELGIVSINTGFTESKVVDANGNAHKQIGSYLKMDGSTGTATDVWFKADKMFTIVEEGLDVPADIVALPDLRGSGNVYDLHQAMVRDTSGQLQSLVRQFIAAADPAVRSGLMDQIFFKWTGSEGISPTSRGPFFDARKLVTLEKILGENFVQDSNPAPGPGAVHPLNDAYKTLSESTYGQLMAQTHLKDLYAQITYSWDAAASCIRADLNGARTLIQNELNENYSSGQELLSEFIRTIRGLDADEKTNLSSFCEAFAGHVSQFFK